MLRVRTVLHPIDFDGNPSTAFDVACALARDYKAELVFVHVVEPTFVNTADGMPQPIPSGMEDAARDRLRAVPVSDPPAAVRHVVTTGNPIDEIVRAAAAAKADLIVMGTHGRTGWSRLVMGSVAEGVLRQAACPVVTVRNLPPSPDAVVQSGKRSS